MNIATGAINYLLPKLAELLVGEYKLQKGAQREIEELQKELTSITAALCMVAGVPADQLDPQVKILASEWRELSYDIEDAVDNFMLHGKGHQHSKTSSFTGFLDRFTNLYNKAKNNHQFHNIFKVIMEEAKKARERYERNTVGLPAPQNNSETIDPRLDAVYRDARDLVGIDGPKKELAERLMKSRSSSSKQQKQKIISIVGFGGMGKTTLANELLRELESKFECHAFVTVSQNPDIKNILKKILGKLDKNVSIDEAWDVEDLISKIREFFKMKRCLCVIDDLWEESSWNFIKLAFPDGNHGSNIIITTRSMAVAEKVGGGIYELKHLSNDDSRKLLNKRIFGTEVGCIPSLKQVTEEIINKCGGVPLVIITISSLLERKSKAVEEWENVSKSIGSGLENTIDVGKMRKILSLSYNDLPFDLKNCLLLMSKYPEDMVIRKDVLIWSWIAEGFITPAGTINLQEIGENYFNELINRNLIQPVHSRPFGMEDSSQVNACQVHDIVLELINQMSAEEGFVTTLLPDGQQASTCTSAVQRKNIRRLSLHKGNKSYASLEEREQLSKVRSLTIFSNVDKVPPMSGFRVLRVLQLEDCSHLGHNHLKDVSKLHLLRFLRLRGLSLTQLPKSIGNLESLETLDLRGTRSVILLPVSFGKLGKLIRLHAEKVKLPDGLTLEKMESLQELEGICLTSHSITEICKLRELNVLGLTSVEENLEGASAGILINMCLAKCSRLRVFDLRTPAWYFADFIVRVPSSLQRFRSHAMYRNTFPKWINASLSCLTTLSIRLVNVCIVPEHLQKLAALPALHFLSLFFVLNSEEQEKLIIPISESAFPCLTDLHVRGGLMFLRFQQGAMQKLETLYHEYNPIACHDKFGTYADYGFENLPSLRHVAIRILVDCPEVQHDIRKAIDDHPNHPSLDICTR